MPNSAAKNANKRPPLRMYRRMDLHSQKADSTELSEEDRARVAGIREAGKKVFLSQESSLWVLTPRSNSPLYICPCIPGKENIFSSHTLTLQI